MTFGLLARGLLVILAGAAIGGALGFSYDLYTIVGTVEVGSPLTGQRVSEGALLGATMAVLVVVVGAIWLHLKRRFDDRRRELRGRPR